MGGRCHIVGTNLTLTTIRPHDVATYIERLQTGPSRWTRSVALSKSSDPGFMT
jgi:hypothetical protein